MATKTSKEKAAPAKTTATVKKTKKTTEKPEVAKKVSTKNSEAKDLGKGKTSQKTEKVVLKEEPKTEQTINKTEVKQSPITTTKSKLSPTLEKGDFSIEAKLKALFEFQQIDSKIDRIRTIRGELPIEVRDLEDEIAGLETRIENYSEETKGLEEQIVNKKQSIKDSNTAIKKYQTQQNNVKNNREYDSLTKEIEFQNLEIQLAEKRIKEFTAEIQSRQSVIEASNQTLNERKNDLEQKKSELESIVEETKKEEEFLLKKSAEAANIIENRLYTAYRRLRENARNGLAVVTIQRDACGGCFNKIPPQRQLDIKQRKKIIVCEHCGRILVDSEISSELVD